MLYALEYTSNRDALFGGFSLLVPRADEQPDAFRFARELVEGYLTQAEAVDTIVQKSSPRWRVKRMSVIDRNILRLATYEIFHRPDVPPRVVINEAVELAKRFGAEQTKSFVNGILQQVCVDNDVAL